MRLLLGLAFLGSLWAWWAVGGPMPAFKELIREFGNQQNEIIDRRLRQEREEFGHQQNEIRQEREEFGNQQNEIIDRRVRQETEWMKQQLEARREQGRQALETVKEQGRQAQELQAQRAAQRHSFCMDRYSGWDRLNCW